jgi:hypothetical protein
MIDRTVGQTPSPSSTRLTRTYSGRITRSYHLSNLNQIIDLLYWAGWAFSQGQFPDAFCVHHQISLIVEIYPHHWILRLNSAIGFQQTRWTDTYSLHFLLISLRHLVHRRLQALRLQSQSVRSSLAILIPQVRKRRMQPSYHP